MHGASAAGAFRKQPFRETCGLCGEFSTAECRRCGRPLCVGHAHDDGRRCYSCELGFSEQLALRIQDRATSDRQSANERATNVLLAATAVPVAGFVVLLGAGVSAVIAGWLAATGLMCSLTVAKAVLKATPRRRQLTGRRAKQDLRVEFLQERLPARRSQ